MKSCPIHGLVAATHTAFNPDSSLNLEAIEKQAAHLLKSGVGYAFICGTTGESHSLTTPERMNVATRWMEVTRGTSLGVMVHVGSNCLTDSRTLAAHAQQVGAKAVSAMPPSYFKPRTVASLVDCCADTAAAAPDLPFFYYDIPALTGVALPMAEFLNRAAERIPNLAGLKFSNTDLMMFQQCLRAGNGGMSISFGCDEFLLAALSLGGTSGIGSTYNFSAPVSNRLIQAFNSGDLKTARVEQYRTVQLVAALAARGYLPASKAVMGFLGVNVGPMRLPHVNLTEEQTSSLRKELEALGFFDWLG